MIVERETPEATANYRRVVVPGARAYAAPDDRRPGHPVCINIGPVVRNERNMEVGYNALLTVDEAEYMAAAIQKILRNYRDGNLSESPTDTRKRRSRSRADQTPAPPTPDPLPDWRDLLRDRPRRPDGPKGPGSPDAA